MSAVWRSVFSRLSPAGARARLSIAIFHRVLPERDPIFPGEVTAAEFARICEWFRDWFSPMPLDEAVGAFKSGALPARALAITFDDGYADNHDVALPILQRYGLSATFFVASAFLDGGRMWNDTLIESIRRTERRALDLEGTAAGSLGKLPCSSLAERQGVISRLIASAKYLPQPERLQWVEAVAERAGAALPQDLMMTSEQVRALHRAGMGVGAHTVNHPILASVDVATMRHEIEAGRQHLEQIIDGRVALFAYPNGQPGSDFGPEAVAIVRELGFDAAVSTSWGAARIGDDPFQLPRFTPWDRTRNRFGLRMARNLWSRSV